MASQSSALPTGRKLTGSARPRLFTPPLRPLNRRTSKGYEVADFAALIGEPLLPWQRWAAIHAMETLPGGGYRFRVVLVLVARQNGKSSLGRTLTLWRMYVDGARTVLGVAQGLGLAREMWSLALASVRACPDLADELTQVRNVNGDEWWKLSSGARYLIRASSREAGRGLSIDQLNIDELREWRTWAPWSALSKTTMARPDALIFAMSNAGDDESVVLNQLREAALSGQDPSIGIFEWSAPDGCDLDDPAAWQAANPGLGHTVSAAALRSALATDPPNVFRTECLCQRVEQLDGAIDLAAWKDCADQAGTMDGLRNRLAACFDMAPDGQHATLAVAGIQADGRPRVEIVAAWKSSDTARAELPGWLDKIKPVAAGWYPTGPAAAFAPILRARANATELTGMRVAEACQGLADLTRARQVVHADQALLNVHVQYASKLPSGDGWRFTRRGGGEQGHVDAAYAAAGAVNIAQTMPPPKQARVRIVA